MFRDENLLPRVVCFSWDPHPPTQALAQQTCSNLYPLDPPPLLDIVRARIRNLPQLAQRAAAYEARI